MSGRPSNAAAGPRWSSGRTARSPTTPALLELYGSALLSAGGPLADGGESVLGAGELARIAVPADELAGYAFCTPHEARPRLTDRNARRLTAALRARDSGVVAYLDNGQPPD